MRVAESHDHMQEQWDDDRTDTTMDAGGGVSFFGLDWIGLGRVPQDSGSFAFFIFVIIIISWSWSSIYQAGNGTGEDMENGAGQVSGIGIRHRWDWG